METTEIGSHSLPHPLVRTGRPSNINGLAHSNKFDDHKRRVDQARENFPQSPMVICLSDLNDQAAKTQAAHIAAHAPHDPQKRPHIEAMNCVPAFSTIGAAHDLADCFANDQISPAEATTRKGKVIVITVDPHVGKNAGGKHNLENPRVICKFDDGTVLIGPGRDYMRVGEFHGRKLERVVQIDREKLIKFGFTQRSEGDVFDGLSQFAPAAAAVLHDTPLELLGDELPLSAIPELKIKAGTVTMIEDGYGNLRLESDANAFQQGQKIAVCDKDGRVLCIATRTEAFNGQKGDIVIPNGSKTMITDGKKKAVYLCAVEDNLAEILAKKLGRKFEIGEELELRSATQQEIVAFDASEKVREIYGNVARQASQVLQAVPDQIGLAVAKITEGRGAISAKFESVLRGVARVRAAVADTLIG